MEIGSMLIIGAIVSLIVQAIKKFAGTSEFWTLFAVVVVSLIGGGLWWVAENQTAYWGTFLQILTAAGAVYTFIIKRFET